MNTPVIDSRNPGQTTFRASRGGSVVGNSAAHEARDEMCDLGIQSRGHHYTATIR